MVGTRAVVSCSFLGQAVVYSLDYLEQTITLISIVSFWDRIHCPTLEQAEWSSNNPESIVPIWNPQDDTPPPPPILVWTAFRYSREFIPTWWMKTSGSPLCCTVLNPLLPLSPHVRALLQSHKVSACWAASGGCGTWTVHTAFGPFVHTAFGPFVHTAFGPSVHTAFGPSIHTGLGSSVHACLGPSVHTAFGPSVHTAFGPFVHTAFGPFVHTAFGPSIHTGLGSSVHAGLGPSVHAAFGPSVHTAFGPSVHTGLGSSVHASLGSSVHAGLGPSVHTGRCGPSVHTGRCGPSVHGGLVPCVHTAFGPSVHTGLGFSVHAALGPSIHTDLGPSVHGGLGPCVHTAFGPSVHTSLGPCIHTAFGPSVHTGCGPSVTILREDGSLQLGGRLVWLLVMYTHIFVQDTCVQWELLFLHSLYRCFSLFVFFSSATAFFTTYCDAVVWGRVLILGRCKFQPYTYRNNVAVVCWNALQTGEESACVCARVCACACTISALVHSA